MPFHLRFPSLLLLLALILTLRERWPRNWRGARKGWKLGIINALIEKCSATFPLPLARRGRGAKRAASGGGRWAVCYGRQLLHGCRLKVSRTFAARFSLAPNRIIHLVIPCSLSASFRLPAVAVCALCLGRRVGCVIYVTRNANTWVNMQARHGQTHISSLYKCTWRKSWAKGCYGGWSSSYPCKK